MSYKENAKIRELMDLVYYAEEGRGYNPIDMIADYLATGDPSYITSNNSARSKITRIDRGEIVVELLKMYFGK